MQGEVEMLRETMGEMRAQETATQRGAGTVAAETRCGKAEAETEERQRGKTGSSRRDGVELAEGERRSVGRQRQCGR